MAGFLNSNFYYTLFLIKVQKLEKTQRLCYNLKKSKGVFMTVTQEKSRTNVYLDVQLKEQAKEIYKQYGLSLSQAVNIFLAQSVFNRGLPFEVKLPNEETLEAMRDVATGNNYEDVTLEDLK